MADFSSLRQNGSFPGTLIGILEEHEARLVALEAHKQETAPMVASYQAFEQERSDYEAERNAREAEITAKSAELKTAEEKPAESEHA